MVARNCLSGTVSRVHRGAVNAEVIVALKGGASVVAVITRDSLRHMALAPASRSMRSSRPQVSFWLLPVNLTEHGRIEPARRHRYHLSAR